MKLEFRQGIVNRQHDISGSPVNVVRSSGDPSYVDLIVAPTPTIVTLAHGRYNYTVVESKGIDFAWGSFSSSSTDIYLLLDLDLVSAKVSYVSTIHPIYIDEFAPTNPVNDQHWFDLTVVMMKVWDGDFWRPKARVLLATLTTSGSIIFPPLGSQVDLDGDIESGFVIIDDELKPISRHDGSLVTTVDRLITSTASSLTAYHGLQLEPYLKPVTTSSMIAAYTLVKLVSDTEVVPSNYSQASNRVAGMILFDLPPGESQQLINSGRIVNVLWNWSPSSIGAPIFSDTSGQITLSPPNVGVSQQVGTILDSNSIMLNIQQPIIL